MPRPSKKKEYPLSMRLPEPDIAIIDRAADLRGRSRTDFVREAAVQAAEAVLMQNTLLRMSPQGFERFMALVSAPPKPVPALVKLFKRKSPLLPMTSRVSAQFSICNASMSAVTTSRSAMS